MAETLAKVLRTAVLDTEYGRPVTVGVEMFLDAVCGDRIGTLLGPETTSDGGFGRESNLA